MKPAEKKYLKDFPQIPDLLAIGYMSLTMVIMAYSFLYKIFPIMTFFAMWFGHIYYKKVFMLRPTTDMLFMLLIPLLCVYSAFWSDYPTVSFYAGAALTSMAFCVIIIARCVTAEAFIKGLTLGTMITLIINLMNNTTAHDEFSATVAHVGLFGSKNEAGFFGEIGVYAALLILISKMKLRDKFIFGLLPLGVSAVTLYTSKSASSNLSLVVAIAVACAAYVLYKMPRTIRLLSTTIGLFTLLTVGLVAAATSANVFDPVLKLVGKDSTLTGRTYLWAEGIRNGMERPLLGYGFFGFWQPGRPEAEHYWMKFDIPSKSGFHFHNLYIQAFVDLGFFGLTIIAFYILCCLFKSFRAVIRNGLEPESGLALGISVMFLIRAFVEVDLFGPFGLGPLLYFSVIPRLAREWRAKKNAR